MVLHWEPEWVMGVCAWLSVPQGTLLWICVYVSAGVGLCLCACMEEGPCGLKTNQTHGCLFPCSTFLHSGVHQSSKWDSWTSRILRVCEKCRISISGPAQDHGVQICMSTNLLCCFLGTFKLENFCIFRVSSLISSQTAWGKCDYLRK